MATKGRRRPKKKSANEDIDKIYLCNLNFVPPKDQNLETIFEEPRQSKDGEKILTSKIKYKRYLNFDPTTNKIQKRKRKAKKCIKKLKSAYRVTRSSPEISQRNDISVFIDVLGDSSSDSNQDTPNTASHKVKQRCDTPVLSSSLSKASTSCLTQESSCSDVFETPKKHKIGIRRSDTFQNPPEILNPHDEAESTNDTQETTLAEEDSTSLESPRKSCLVS